MIEPRTCTDILHTAASRIQLVGWCQGSHARDGAGRSCSVHAPASGFSMYGAISNAVGPGVGYKALQNSNLWRLVRRRAAAIVVGVSSDGCFERADHALDFLNDDPKLSSVAAIGFLRLWAEDPEIVALGEFR